MTKWTEEQELAIEKVGMNIIVSAGAGSGKTAVLTERVIRKLKRGIDVNELLILTFTNAAAKEMKERIRSAIKKEGLKDQLLKIDSSFITTFDSFSLSVVKKYHYLLNIDNDIEIANDLVLKFKKRKILEEIFKELYEKKDDAFLTFIKDFTTKDDASLQDVVLEIYDKINLKYDKREFMDNYLNTYYNDSFINSKIDEYLIFLTKKQNKIEENLREIELMVDGDFYQEFLMVLNPIIESNNYDEIKKNLDVTLPRLKKGMTDVKPYKEKISKLISDLKKLTIYESIEEIKESIYLTKGYVEVILKIIKDLDKRFTKYKQENKLYDFLDIASLAIKIVKNYNDAREELKNGFKEILVDEYQDTSDLQELFINLISNNNVYMVGDIKQSIYRFRNANPNLFKEKYLNYEKNQGGFKIDLLKNFRSREETLNNINYIFDFIMDVEIGGADYKKSHRMIFGNTTYNEYKMEGQNNNFELYNYIIEDKEYSKDEVEAFITVLDIKKKVEDKYQVYDKNLNALRDITYDDFVILMDKSTNFSLYKKIFLYHGVTLTIVKDENISDSYDLFILKNILILLSNLKEKKLDKEFLYSYLSLGRSYLFSLPDDILYERINKKDFNNDPVVNIAKNLVLKLDSCPLPVLIQNILVEFDFYSKLITVGNIEEAMIRLEYLEQLSNNLGNLGYTYIEFISYLKKMIDNKEKIEYSLNKEVKNSVKIMTIHKSKGLEYPICYYTGLTSKFNVMDVKKKFSFSDKFGIITPFVKNGIESTIYQSLYKDYYIKEDISERIRLFYVALTRAREKMILITSLKDEEIENDEMVEIDTRLKYTSFSSILNSISNNLLPYLKEIDLKTIPLTKNYTMFQKNNIFDELKVTDEKLTIQELNLKENKKEEQRFSKENNHLITKEEKEKLEFGVKLHSYFEYVDFKKKDISFLESKFQSYFKMFFASPITKNIKNANIYKEYEFIYEKDDKEYHGIIDLILEYEDFIDIIDYKLKNIKDKEYDNQLKGYRDYMESRTNKPIHLYLYSILTGEIEEIS